MCENECVTDLQQRAPPGAPNDVEFMVDSYKLEGMWSYSCEMDSSDYLGFVRRIRQWWAAALIAAGWSEADVSAWFTSLLMHFKWVNLKNRFSIADVLECDITVRQEVATAVGVPLFSEFGPRHSQCKKDDVGWKLEHLQMFSTCNLQWPFTFDEVDTPSRLHRDGVFLREQEELVFLDTLWPPSAEDSDVCFCDINPTLLRVVDSCMENGWPKIKAEDPPAPSPWQTRCRTQVGSGKMIVRHRMAFHQQQATSKVFCIRLVEAFEAMRMIGYSDSFWGKTSDLQFSRVEDLFYLTNIAGNSYSMFHYLPWHCALLSVYGRYQENHLAKDEDEDEDDGEPASSEDHPYSAE